MLNELFEPDGKRLTSMLIGSPGTGKSFWTKHQLLAFSKRWKDENGRIVYCCPKGEMDLGEDTWTPMHKLEKHMMTRVRALSPAFFGVMSDDEFCTILGLRKGMTDTDDNLVDVLTRVAFLSQVLLCDSQRSDQLVRCHLLT